MGERRTMSKSWADVREGDRCHDVATGRRGVIKIWPGGPVIQWENGELEPDIMFDVVQRETQAGGADE